eukprot:jgi/Tetstr1/420481/TSEL_011594.t1
MVVQRHLSRAIRLRDFVALDLSFQRTGAAASRLDTLRMYSAGPLAAVGLHAGGVGGGPACDYMIDFACVSSTTPTWSNDPCWCTPGIAATEAEHGKLAADRASSAPV